MELDWRGILDFCTHGAEGSGAALLERIWVRRQVIVNTLSIYTVFVQSQQHVTVPANMFRDNGLGPS
jgi:hypothetical protein